MRSPRLTHFARCGIHLPPLSEETDRFERLGLRRLDHEERRTPAR